VDTSKRYEDGNVRAVRRSWDVVVRQLTQSRQNVHRTSALNRTGKPKKRAICVER
jgi:hypothetical protein